MRSRRFSMQARGHNLMFRSAGAAGSGVPLTLFGERQFDNLVVFARSLTEAAIKGKGAVTVADIMGFVEDGGE